MRPIIMLMLAVDVGVILATAWAVVGARSRPDRRRPVWASFAVALAICASTSFNIGDRHDGEPGADLLQFAAPLLIGMALMAILMLIRQRRGLDSGAPPSA